MTELNNSVVRTLRSVLASMDQRLTRIEKDIVITQQCVSETHTNCEDALRDHDEMIAFLNKIHTGLVQLYAISTYDKSFEDVENAVTWFHHKLDNASK
jgi:hypothetical protein